MGPIQDHLTQTPKGHCPQVAPIQGGLGATTASAQILSALEVELVSRRWTERPYK